MQKAENDFVRRQCSGRNLMNRTSELYGNEMMSALKQDMAGKDIMVDDKESYVRNFVSYKNGKILKTKILTRLTQNVKTTSILLP